MHVVRPVVPPPASYVKSRLGIVYSLIVSVVFVLF